MFGWALDIFSPQGRARAGRERWHDVCANLDDSDGPQQHIMGASTNFMRKGSLPERVDMIISLAIYVLPRLSIQTTTAIERNVAVKFGESLMIQRAIMRETTQRRSLNAVMKGFNAAAHNSHDEALRLFTHLCDIIGQSAQGGMTVRGRLNAVASRLNVPSDQASAIIKRHRI